MSFHSSSPTSSVGVRLVLPAQLTRTSIWPKAASVASRRASSEARSATSHGWRRLRRPRASISAATSATSAGAPPRRDDVGARLGEPERERASDARRAADDDGDAPREIARARAPRQPPGPASARETISRASFRISSRCAALVMLSA